MTRPASVQEQRVSSLCDLLAALPLSPAQAHPRTFSMALEIVL